MEKFVRNRLLYPKTTKVLSNYLTDDEETQIDTDVLLRTYAENTVDQKHVSSEEILKKRELERNILEIRKSVEIFCDILRRKKIWKI